MEKQIPKTFFYATEMEFPRRWSQRVFACVLESQTNRCDVNLGNELSKQIVTAIDIQEISSTTKNLCM